MMPYSEINIGDVYSNPVHRGFGKHSGLEWVVIDKNDEEKLIRFRDTLNKYSTMWKPHTNRMFSESWRLLIGLG